MTQSAIQLIQNKTNSDGLAPLVFLHGWGSDSRAWQKLRPYLDDKYSLIFIDLPGFGLNSDCEVPNMEALYSALENVIPFPCHLIGWSLGGMIAIELAARNNKRVLSLCTIATNAKFVSSRDWPQACAPKVFENFVAAFSASPAVCTKKFIQLQALGDKDSQSCVTFLKKLAVDYSQAGTASCDRHLKNLEFLRCIDNRDSLQKLQVPCLAILGENDALVPRGVAEVMRETYPQLSVEIIAGAAHAPHITRAQKVAQLIEFTVERGKQKIYTRTKQRVAKAFSAAASQYDSVAELQKRVASNLLRYHQGLHGDIQGRVCDIGCGTGFCAEFIDQKNCELVGLDIAFGMLKHCQEHKPYSTKHLLCADFDALPFQKDCFDGLVSSMSLQWSENLCASLRQMKEVLKPKSWLSFSTLGPKTLHELSLSWQAVDHYVHVNSFDTLEDVKKSLHESGFTLRQHKVEHEVLAYDSVMDLMKDLKSIGAHNVNAGNRSGLTTRHQLRLVTEAYEQYRKRGSLPATYEVFYFLAGRRT